MAALAVPPTSPLPVTEAQSYLTASFTGTTFCGDLYAQHNSYAKTLSTVIMGAVQVEPEKSSKKKKKKLTSDPRPEGACFLITCADSVIFPMGGGQPCDRGKLEVPSLGLTFQIHDSSNISNVCVLTAYTSTEVPDVGALVNLPVTMSVDWERRIDHMQQHTAQHVISAIALDKFHLDTHSWTLTGPTEPTTVEFKLAENDETAESFTSLDALLSSSPFDDIERTANGHIFANRKVTPSWLDVDSDEYKNTVRSRLLPKGFSGAIRVVEIDQVDKSTCCGTHVASLSHLTAIKVLRLVKVGKNIVRLSFVSGQRILDFIANSLLHQNAIESVVSTPNLEDQVVRIQNLSLAKAKNEKTIASLWAQLAILKAENLSKHAKANSFAVDDLGADLVDKDVYKNLASAVIERAPGSTVFLLSGGLEAGFTFYMQGDAKVVDGNGKQVAAILGGRGGGKGGSMMGKIPSGDLKHDANVRSRLKEIEELLKNSSS